MWSCSNASILSLNCRFPSCSWSRPTSGLVALFRRRLLRGRRRLYFVMSVESESQHHQSGVSGPIWTIHAAKWGFLRSSGPLSHTICRFKGSFPDSGLISGFQSHQVPRYVLNVVLSLVWPEVVISAQPLDVFSSANFCSFQTCAGTLAMVCRSPGLDTRWRHSAAGKFKFRRRSLPEAFPVG